jgi:hypothetical protein
LINAFQIKKYFETSKFFPTCCLSVKKRVFDLVGKFDARLESSGDLEFGQRVYQSGLRQGYADSIVLSHPPRETYWALCKKSMRIARGIAQCCFYYPARYNGRKSKILDWRKFIPRNPFNLKKIYSNMNIPLRWPDAILLAFFGIPQSIMSVFAFCIETQRLKSNSQS